MSGIAFNLWFPIVRVLLYSLGNRRLWHCQCKKKNCVHFHQGKMSTVDSPWIHHHLRQRQCWSAFLRIPLNWWLLCVSVHVYIIFPSNQLFTFNSSLYCRLVLCISIITPLTRNNVASWHHADTVTLVSDIVISDDNVEILQSTSRGEGFLLTLEALHIRERKPSINTKDEYRSRELVIKL